MLCKEKVKEIVGEFADLVVKDLSPVSIILYGSHAKGNASINSDIDVAVIYDGLLAIG